MYITYLHDGARLLTIYRRIGGSARFSKVVESIELTASVLYRCCFELLRQIIALGLTVHYH